MKKRAIIIFACFLFLTSYISATATIQIKTLPDHELFITELDAFQDGNIAVASPIHTFTGNTGLVKLEYTPKKTQFRLGLLLKKDDKKIIRYTPLEDIYYDDEISEITFLPEGMSWEDVKPIKEETTIITSDENETEVNNQTDSSLDVENNTQDLTNEKELTETENDTGIFKGILINGHAIIQENKNIINVASYFLGAVILVGIIYILFKRRKKNKKGIVSMVSKKFDSEDDEENDSITRAEEDLKKAKERIKELKGKKIEEAKRKIIEDEKELLRLKNMGKEDDD